MAGAPYTLGIQLSPTVALHYTQEKQAWSIGKTVTAEDAPMSWQGYKVVCPIENLDMTWQELDSLLESLDSSLAAAEELVISSIAECSPTALSYARINVGCYRERSAVVAYREGSGVSLPKSKYAVILNKSSVSLSRTEAETASYPDKCPITAAQLVAVVVIAINDLYVKNPGRVPLFDDELKCCAAARNVPGIKLV